MKKVFIPLSLLALFLNSCHDCSQQERKGDYRKGYDAGKDSKENDGNSSCLDTWMYAKEADEQRGFIPPDKQCMCEGYVDGYNGKTKKY
jgi:hypothetical protein